MFVRDSFASSRVSIVDKVSFCTWLSRQSMICLTVHRFCSLTTFGKSNVSKILLACRSQQAPTGGGGANQDLSGRRGVAAALHHIQIYIYIYTHQIICVCTQIYRAVRLSVCFSVCAHVSIFVCADKVRMHSRRQKQTHVQTEMSILGVHICRCVGSVM